MEHRYADLLSDEDLAALGRLSGGGPDDEGAVAWFRNEPGRIEAALDAAGTADALFAAGPRATHPPSTTARA